MKIARSIFYARRSAFTRTDLFTLLTLITIVLTAVTITTVINRPKKLQNQCVDNLRNISLATRIWATDSTDDFPFQRSTNHGGTKEFRQVWPHFQVLSNELSKTRILLCPETKTAPAKSWPELRDTNITYFIGLTAEETLPQSLLSGDAGFVISGKPPETNVVFLTTTNDVSFPYSIHRSIGNVALGDGSVQRLSAMRLKEQLRQSGLSTNILLLPR